MGGVDKGLQNFNGTPLALNALLRLQMQEGGLVGDLMVNANRNLAAYEAFGVPVWPDTLTDYAGPLAGFLTGLERCETPYLLTVPCDSPLFPLDLAQRWPRPSNRPTPRSPWPRPRGRRAMRAQPVFCLMRRDLLESLVPSPRPVAARSTAGPPTAPGGALRPPGRRPAAFFNANTLAELHALEKP
jgi:molybdenum cofactor guanylyltransferase